MPRPRDRAVAAPRERKWPILDGDFGASVGYAIKASNGSVKKARFQSLEVGELSVRKLGVIEHEGAPLTS
jgi:hypothetical protein